MRYDTVKKLKWSNRLPDHPENRKPADPFVRRISLARREGPPGKWNTDRSGADRCIEQPIKRLRKKQLKHFSGKKKRHTQKAHVIVNQFSRLLLPPAISMTFVCSKAIALRWPIAFAVSQIVAIYGSACPQPNTSQEIEIASAWPSSEKH